MGKKEKAEARAKRRRNRLLKRTVIWILFLAALGVGVFFLARVGGDGEAFGAIEPVNSSDWMGWNPDAGVTLVEYSDFQCPACSSYFSIIKGLEDEFSRDVRIVYRNFPLSQVHSNADVAAGAAEAAGNQGKFWEMHDMLFANQSQWAGSNDAENIFAGYASQLGLDVERFREDINSDEVKNRVSEDYQEGVSAGIDSTPTFYVNGKRIQSPSGSEEFREILNKAIEESRI